MLILPRLVLNSRAWKQYVPSMLTLWKLVSKSTNLSNQDIFEINHSQIYKGVNILLWKVEKCVRVQPFPLRAFGPNFQIKLTCNLSHFDHMSHRKRKILHTSLPLTHQCWKHVSYEFEVMTCWELARPISIWKRLKMTNFWATYFFNTFLLDEWGEHSYVTIPFRLCLTGWQC